MLPYAVGALSYVHGTNNICGYKMNPWYVNAFIGSAIGYIISTTNIIRPELKMHYGPVGTSCLLLTCIVSTY
jgi:hypothetical protein